MDEIIETLQSEHERLSRMNGQLEMALRIQEWALRNRDRLPEWAIAEISSIVATATEVLH